MSHRMVCRWLAKFKSLVMRSAPTTTKCNMKKNMQYQKKDAQFPGRQHTMILTGYIILPNIIKISQRYESYEAYQVIQVHSTV